MAQKFLAQSGGQITETAPAVAGGAGDANKIPALDVNGRLTNAMLPSGIGADTIALLASEALSAGAFVNIYSNAGTENVRNADASVSGKPAMGFVLAAFASGATATVYLNGMNTSVTGATVGPAFLSDTTPGGSASTSPTTTGHVSQNLGDAVSATQIHFTRRAEIVLG
jgi:hypothetical protein